MNPPPIELKNWKSLLVGDLDRVAARHYWGRAVMAIGWIHFGVFALCHYLYRVGQRQEWLFLTLWGLELGCVVGAVRLIAGRGWWRSTPLAGLIARVWITFLILSFNLASMNSLSGLENDWFKPPLATLSSFGFMVMAYLVSPWFFIPAVHMYLTGVLMRHHYEYCYLIYGVSWCLLLQGIGLVLERRRQFVSSGQLSAPVGQLRTEERAA